MALPHFEKIEIPKSKLNFEIEYKLPSIMETKERLIDSDVIDVKITGETFAPSFIIRFSNELVFEKLKNWYNVIWNSSGQMSYKMDIVGDIIIKQHDKTGLVLRELHFFAAQVKCITESEFHYEVEFIADFFEDKYCDSKPLDVTFSGKSVSNTKDLTTFNGYHTTEIKKGEIGTISKIQEELDELKDAEKQNSKIMMMVELSDLYGALEEFCLAQKLTIEDLRIFSDITKRAFKNGRR